MCSIRKDFESLERHVIHTPLNPNPAWLKTHPTTNLPLVVGPMPSLQSPPPPSRPPSSAATTLSFLAEVADDEEDRPPPEMDSVAVDDAVGLDLLGGAVLEVIPTPSRQSLPSVKTNHSLSWTPPTPRRPPPAAEPPRRHFQIQIRPHDGDRRAYRRISSSLVFVPPSLARRRAVLPNSRGSRRPPVLGRGRLLVSLEEHCTCRNVQETENEGYFAPLAVRWPSVFQHTRIPCGRCFSVFSLT